MGTIYIWIPTKQGSSGLRTDKGLTNAIEAGEIRWCRSQRRDGAELFVGGRRKQCTRYRLSKLGADRKGGGIYVRLMGNDSKEGLLNPAPSEEHIQPISAASIQKTGDT